MEGNNVYDASQPTINQSVQSGISTPRPDSGFVDNEENEVNGFSTFLRKYRIFNNCLLVWGIWYSLNILIFYQGEITRCYKKVDIILQELIDTEVLYGEVLKTVVDTYIPFMEESKKETRDKGVPPMPEELKAGRDRIALGNIRQIHTYQKK